MGILLVVVSAVLSFNAFLEKKDGRKRPRGVVVFAVLLMCGSLYKSWGFMDYDYYRFMFQSLDKRIVIFRYGGSVALRIAGIAVAIGTLGLKERSHRYFIWLSIFTLGVLYWKHPPYVFEQIAHNTEQLFLNTTAADPLVYPVHPWISLSFHYLTDIVFSGSALYYFTRPSVKEHFSK